LSRRHFPLWSVPGAATPSQPGSPPANPLAAAMISEVWGPLWDDGDHAPTSPPPPLLNPPPTSWGNRILLNHAFLMPWVSLLPFSIPRSCAPPHFPPQVARLSSVHTGGVTFFSHRWDSGGGGWVYASRIQGMSFRSREVGSGRIRANPSRNVARNIGA